jgi:glycosyltransferase involved in cell wall biosynthesis
LARDNDVTILFGDLDGRAFSKQELEAWLMNHPDAPRMTLAYVAPSRLAILCERLHSRPGLRPFYYWAYQLWQKRALKVARALHCATPFDIVHQLTYATFWEPGYLWRLGIPFFWGPIAGANVIPLRYLSVLGVQGAIEAVARYILNAMTLMTHPRIGAASRHARHIWCVTEREHNILSRFTTRTSMMLEGGTVPGDAHTRVLGPGQTLRIVWSGLHIPRKALPLLIRAIGRLNPNCSVAIDILGAGRGSNKETEKSKSLAEELGVASKFTWHGNLPRDQALEKMRNAHLLVHTSLLESTSWVVLEALSSGMPVICHDACGMANAVTPDCGIKIPMTGVEDSVRGFSRAIQTLIDEPARIQQLSEGAVLRAQGLGWELKVAEINRAYEESFQATAK